MKTVLTLILVLVGAGALRADDKDDRERRVRVALALSNAMGPRVEIAPPPRSTDFELVQKLPYLDAYKIATAESRPLIVFVKCDCDPLTPRGTVASRSESFGDYPPKTVLVIYARNGVAHVHKTFKCPVDNADLKKAVDEVNKILQPTISSVSGPCICGDSCKCKSGDCPGKCPVIAAPCDQ